jgi:hypothetical protein
MGPRRSSDSGDEVTFSFPVRPECKVALLATKEDYGAYVRAALEDEKLSTEGGDVLAASDELTVDELVKQWSEGDVATQCLPSCAPHDRLKVAHSHWSQSALRPAVGRGVPRQLRGRVPPGGRRATRDAPLVRRLRLCVTPFLIHGQGKSG